MSLDERRSEFDCDFVIGNKGRCTCYPLSEGDYCTISRMERDVRAIVCKHYGAFHGARESSVRIRM